MCAMFNRTLSLTHRSWQVLTCDQSLLWHHEGCQPILGQAPHTKGKALSLGLSSGRSPPAMRQPTDLYYSRLQRPSVGLRAHAVGTLPGAE